jgi:hypothetical protein
MLVYATTTDLAAWPDAPNPLPSNADRLLRNASLLIADQTSSAVYTVDDTGLPTDPVKLQALNDACCAQASTWIALGIDPAAGTAGVTAAVVAKKVGSASITRSQTAEQQQARMAAVDQLCDQAVLLLRTAGLLSTRVWTY